MKKTVIKTVIRVAVLCVIFVLLLYINNDIGIASGKIEKDIRSCQKIGDDWTVAGEVGDTMAAYISYPADLSDYTYSVYVKHTGLSFGWFFRSGGNNGEIDNYISGFELEGYNENAFISMNNQKVIKLEFDDGNSVKVVEIDENKPFAIVLPANSGNITFYDVDGNTVEYSMRSL